MLPSGAWRTSATLSATCTGRRRRAFGVPVLMSGACLRGRAALIEGAEGRSLAGEAREERRRLPAFAMLAVECRHALVDLLQPDGVGVEHRAAPEAGEAVAGQVDDVDVRGAGREALFENLR